MNETCYSVLKDKYVCFENALYNIHLKKLLSISTIVHVFQ